MPTLSPGRAAAAIIFALDGTDEGGGLYSVGAAQAQIIAALGISSDDAPDLERVTSDGDQRVASDGGIRVTA